MITLFRKNDLVNILFLLPYCVVLRLYSLIYPTAYTVQSSDSYISNYIFTQLIPSAYVQVILAILLVYAQALLINLLINRHRIYQRPSSLAGMTYILMVSCMKELQVLTPALIGMTFIILAAFSVFNTYKQSKAIKAISNSAMSAAMGTIIYPPYAIVIVALLVGLGMLRSFRMKERLQFILSWFVGFWIVGAFLFVLDAFKWNIGDRLDAFSALKEIWPLTQSSGIFIGFLIILMSLVFINYYNYKKKKDIEIRKKIDFFYWILFVSFIAFLAYHNIDMQYLIFICLPIAVFLSLSWMSIKRNSWAELLHFIFVGLIFYNLFIIPT